MNWKYFGKRLRYYVQYLPFTINALLAALALWWAFHTLYPTTTGTETEVSSFRPLIKLMALTALWFLLALIILSVGTTIAAWLHCLWLRNRQQIQLEFSTKPEPSGRGMLIETQIKKVRRPFLGFVKGRLLYNQYALTDKFLLASNQRRPGSFWRQGVTGRSRLLLPDIQEYTIEGGFIYFEDMLQLISLPVRQRLQGHIFRPPTNVDIEERNAVARKTEQTDIRIDELRRVEGAFLNYKDFESGDDVRRIVWKLYARNRELVVKIPETHDPYASHIYFYASFYSDLPTGKLDNAFGAEMLNFLKNRVWTAYDVLASRDLEVRFIADQELHTSDEGSMPEQVQRTISNSNWHRYKNLSDYFQPRFGAVLVISSLTDAAELRQMLDRSSADTVVYFVRLSDAFRHFLPWTWIQRIFLLPPDDRLKKIRSRWMLHPLRFQLQKREKALSAVLESSNVIIGTL